LVLPTARIYQLLINRQMKIFIDTANIDEIKQASELGLIDGVTTNPTLVARETKSFDSLLSEICSVVKGPVSAEVISLDCKGMLEEARKLKKIAENIVIKIPLVKEGLKAVRILEKEKIRTNVTLCFSAMQALLVAKAGASFISPFVGRLDDISHDGMDLVEKIKTIYHNYNFKTEIIVASVRNPLHIQRAAVMGADIVTVPFSVIEKLIKHPLTDIGIKRFLDDYKKIPKK